MLYYNTVDFSTRKPVCPSREDKANKLLHLPQSCQLLVCHQHLTPTTKTQGSLHLNASSGLLWHHLPGLNFLHLPSLALLLASSKPHGHCCYRGAAGNYQFRKKTLMLSEDRCPKASQSSLWGGPAATSLSQHRDDD